MYGDNWIDSQDPPLENLDVLTSDTVVDCKIAQKVSNLPRSFWRKKYLHTNRFELLTWLAASILRA